MLIEHLALVPETPSLVSLSDLTRTAAAVQKQVVRDLAPIWGVQATLDAFTSLEDVPIGYWPVILVEDVPNAGGVHLDKDGQPYALVEAGAGHENWSVTVSHEVLEMVVDPFGRRLVAGGLPQQAENDPLVKNLTRVQYLVEVCDPCEDESLAYTVNDVLVSDFYTQNYFDPMSASGVRYSFRNTITKPREVLPGGYVSFGDPETSHWFQVTWFGAAAIVEDVGVLDITANGSIRAAIDRITNDSRITAQTHVTKANVAKASGAAKATLMAAASGARNTTVKPTSAKAKAWRADIQSFRKP